MTAGVSISAAPRFRRYLFVACSLALTLIAMVVAWEAWKAWANRDFTIKFVGPNGYRGIIVLEEDEDRGVVPKLEADDVYVYTIPASGKLAVKNFNLFRYPNFDAAEYENGEALRTVAPRGRSASNSDKDIVLRGLGMGIWGTRRLYVISVGDYAEHRKHAYEYGFTTERPDAEPKYIGPPKLPPPP